MDNYLNSPYFNCWQPKQLLQFYKWALLASLLHTTLVLLGFKRLMGILNKLQSAPKIQYFLENQEEARSLKRKVNPLFKKIKKSKYFWSNCLSSSILLWWILKKQGLDTVLIIGTKTEDNVFEAHAWIEYKQFPLNENIKIRDKYHVFEHDFSNNHILSFKN